MRVISLDLGTKTCGFAISDINQILANPLENYSYSKNDFMQVINRLKYWFNEYNNEISTIVIGYPTNTIGAKTNMTNYVERFVEKIKNVNLFTVDIILYDERFSTKMGSALLMDLGIKNSTRRKYKDMMAAYIILDNYLKGK